MAVYSGRCTDPSAEYRLPTSTGCFPDDGEEHRPLAWQPLHSSTTEEEEEEVDDGLFVSSCETAICIIVQIPVSICRRCFKHDAIMGCERPVPAVCLHPPCVVVFAAGET